MTHLLPSGIKGIVVAGLLSALMSSLSAMFNSTSTLLTIDVFKKLKPDADEKILVRFGRISTGLMVVLGLLWIPFIGLLSDDRMYVYLQSVQTYVSPPIAAVFLFGLFSSRVNGKGAIAALLTGLFLGVFRLIIEVNNKIEPLANETLKFLASINFLHYAIFLFIVSSLVLITTSMLTPKPSESINSLLFNKKLIYEKNKWLIVNVFASALLVILLLLLWWIFR